MLMKASQTGQSISRVLVQTADWHYNQAAQWWDMYQHCVTEGATFVDDQGVEYSVPDGLIHPDFLPYAKKYLAKYQYHCYRADHIMRTGQGQRLATVKPSRGVVDFAGEFEKAVEQRGQQAKEDFEQRRKKAYVQRKKANRKDTVETLQ